MNPNHQPRKNLSAMKRYTLTLAGLLALGLAVPAAFAADSSAVLSDVALAKSEASAKAEPPKRPLLGASDFLPTPQMPVGFRPNNAWYPGAGRPPLEFWDGTPGEVEVSGTFGNPPKRGTQKVRDCTDTKSKNILWKAPAPGWGLTHPIVVGKKVFAVGHPDVVACYDLDNGKVLWRKRISPAFLDGRPEAQAQGVQVAVDLALALTKGYRCTNPNFVLTFGTVYGGLPGNPAKGGKATGDRVGQFGGGMSFSAVAGTTLVGINNHTGDFRNNRDDRRTVATIVLVDSSDPAKPKVLSDRNLLAYSDPPADLLVAEYLSEFDPLEFACGYGGTAGYFSHMGGPVPVGKRLLIQSSAFLYCIGEE